jgi:hypothetical protein
MSRDRVMRAALWVTVALNALGVAVFAPSALGYPSPLIPLAAPPYYAAQLGYVIALFCGVYGWLAMQREINRPLVIVGALGKLGFFALGVAYWFAGDLPGSVVAKATPDLGLAGIFFWWASGSAARVVLPAAA